MDKPEGAPRPLEGLRILDVATFYAGPVCATILSDFGAEVIKVEMPGSGDTTRRGIGVGENLSYLWLQEGRNKRSITLNLQQPEGRDLLKRLVKNVDAMVENFRPGTLEEWGLGPDVLQEINPRLVLLRVSGYGQTGPYRHKGAFDRMVMAFSGATYATGMRDGPPMFIGYLLGDYMAAFTGAFSLVTALYWRDLRGGQGQVIDLGLYEPVLRSSSALIPAYDQTGFMRGRTGNREIGAVPIGIFQAGDGNWLVLNAESDRHWQRLLRAMGRTDLAGDERYKTAPARVEHQDDVYRLVEEWLAGRTAGEAVEALDAAKVTASKINSIADLVADPHVAARENIVRVPDPRVGSLATLGPVPKFSRTPGRIQHLGPDLGADNEAIYGGLLGLSEDQIAALRKTGTI